MDRCSSAQRWLWVCFMVCNGCRVADMSYVQLRSPHQPLTSRSAESVEVFIAAKPPRPFTEVGLIEARAGTGMSRRDVIDACRREAGRVGCDAIVIIGGIEEEDSEHKLMYYGAGYRASCIVYDSASRVLAGTLAGARPAVILR